MTTITTGPFTLRKASPGLVPCKCGCPADLMYFDRLVRGHTVTLYRVMCSRFQGCPRSSQTWAKQDQAEREWNANNATGPVMGE